MSSVPRLHWRTCGLDKLLLTVTAGTCCSNIPADCEDNAMGLLSLTSPDDVTTAGDGDADGVYKVDVVLNSAVAMGW